MVKIFVGSTYDIKHKKINQNNCVEMLTPDIRSKLIGDTKKFVYGDKNIVLKSNKNIQYIGGFYYEHIPEGFTPSNDCDYIVEAELRQIEEAGLVIIILMNYGAIATITELIYAASHKKQVIIFCNPQITKFNVESEYWFPIITAKRINNKNTKIIFVNNKEEIIDYINNIKEE